MKKGEGGRKRRASSRAGPGKIRVVDCPTRESSHIDSDTGSLRRKERKRGLKQGKGRWSHCENAQKPGTQAFLA